MLYPMDRIIRIPRYVLCTCVLYQGIYVAGFVKHLYLYLLRHFYTFFWFFLESALEFSDYNDGVQITW